jgi:hypothetical protein
MAGQLRANSSRGLNFTSQDALAVRACHRRNPSGDSVTDAIFPDHCSKTRTPEHEARAFRLNLKPKNYNSELVDVVLLPVQGGVGLDDDVFVRVLFQFVDQNRLARLERFGNFRVDAKG